MTEGGEGCDIFFSPSPASEANGGGRGEGRTAGEADARPSAELALNSTSVGKNPASVLPAPVGAISSAERSSRALASSSSWCSRGDQPRAANQRRKRSGSNSAGSAGDSVWMRGGTASELSRPSHFVEGRPAIP